MWLRNRHPKRSTTIYNVISSLLTEEQQELTPYEKLQIGRQYIFNFNYPLPTNESAKDFKEYFEMMFLSKYCNRYFAYNTFEEWQIKLIYMMNSVMSGYSTVLDNVLFNDSETMFYNKSETISTTQNSNESLSLNSEYPQNMLGNPSLNGVNYANDGTKNESSSQNNNTTISYNGNSFEKALEHSEHLSNIINDLLNKFQDLFNMMM